MRCYSIELDCQPGSPRPSDLFPGVIDGLGLDEEDFDNVSRFFGNWVWILKEDIGKDETFTKVKPILKERVETLYGAGAIRYGSW
jgi:hypothetical protein